MELSAYERVGNLVRIAGRAYAGGHHFHQFYKLMNVDDSVAFRKRPILPKVFENVKSTFVLVD